MNSNVRDLNGLNSGNVLSIAEALEARRLLAVSCVNFGTQTLPHYELAVFGTDSEDTIHVQLGANGVEGNLNAGNYVSCPNPPEFIEIWGYDGVDTITVEQNVTTKAIISGGDKFDWIHGGGGDDAIFGEGGGDVITGGGGNDEIDGGAGDDRLSGDGDSDTLTGGAGLDYMFGNEGDDYFNAQDGERDEVYGGDGSDTVWSYDHTNPQDVLSSIEGGTD